MRERLTALNVRAFRGVPDEMQIALPNGSSLVLLGDNGFGKSTVADALEFYFCGSIRALRREGRALLHHAARHPEDMAVEVLTSGSLGGTATKSESSDGARSVGARETFILRGQHLADFVDKPKGEKWKHLFEILGLGSVDEMQRDLKQASYEFEGTVKVARDRLEQAKLELRASCPEADEETLFHRILSVAERANVAPPPSLEIALNPGWEPIASRQGLNAAAKREALVETIRTLPRFPNLNLVRAWNTGVSDLERSQIARNELFQAARPLVEQEDVTACPLCGQAVSGLELREQVIGVVESLQPVIAPTTSASRVAYRFLELLRAAWSLREDLRRRATALGVELQPLPPSSEKTVEMAVKSKTSVDTSELERSSTHLATWDKEAERLVSEMVTPVSQEERELLTLVKLVNQGRVWWEAKSAAAREDSHLRIAKKLHETYVARQNALFSEILLHISGRVAEIYDVLHPNEGLGDVAIETWGDKGVELALEFHGTRHRPPHAVLSESHLNSLGIALFLSMAEAFNNTLGVLVLDDVVNSFDIGHRGALAELLASHYENWQLIVLTHDHVFYQQLARRAPTWKKLELTSWTFEEGPRLAGYDTAGWLEKARGGLLDGDVQGAATKARRALEELLQEACEGMGAHLPFRRGFKNDRREPNELLSSMRRGLKQHRVANQGLDSLLVDVEADLQSTLNIEAHANQQWASGPEVGAAIDRIGQLEDFWTCDNCGTTVWVVGTAGATRCRCGLLGFPTTSKGRVSPGSGSAVTSDR